MGVWKKLNELVLENKITAFIVSYARDDILRLTLYRGGDYRFKDFWEEESIWFFLEEIASWIEQPLG